MRNRNNMFTVFGTLLLLMMTVFGAFGAQYAGSFPGYSEIVSPDKRYVLRNVDKEKEETHELVLLDQIERFEMHIYSYERHIDILWSPDSKSLLINDHGGSDFSTCIVLKLDGKLKRYDVGDLIKTNIADVNRQSIMQNHHVYVEGVEWIDNEQVKIHIHGYGDLEPEGFSFFYKYTVGKELEFISKKP